MAGNVVDLEIDALVLLALDGISAGKIGEKIENARVAHVVLEVASIPFHPGALEIAGSDDGRVRNRAGDGVIGRPIGVFGENIISRFERIATSDHFLEGGKMFFLAAARIVELPRVWAGDVR